jgi:hypothetical protein
MPARRFPPPWSVEELDACPDLMRTGFAEARDYRRDFLAVPRI